MEVDSFNVIRKDIYNKVVSINLVVVIIPVDVAIIEDKTVVRELPNHVVIVVMNAMVRFNDKIVEAVVGLVRVVVSDIKIIVFGKIGDNIVRNNIIANLFFFNRILRTSMLYLKLGFVVTMKAIVVEEKGKTEIRTESMNMERVMDDTFNVVKHVIVNEDGNGSAVICVKHLKRSKS